MSNEMNEHLARRRKANPYVEQTNLVIRETYKRLEELRRHMAAAGLDRSTREFYNSVCKEQNTVSAALVRK